MTSIHIRIATLEDSAAISAVHCSNVPSWKIWEADGAIRPASYADLSPYQRWLNGGPWMDVDSCRFHLNRLLSSGGIPLVAELNERVIAEAEMSIADEPPPYGRNLNLSALYVRRTHQGRGIGSVLMGHALALADSEQCDTFSVANAEAPSFYKRYGLKLAERWVRFEIPIGLTRKSVPAYTTTALEDAPYEIVRGLALPIGRYQNAHNGWERTRPNAVPDFDEWRHLRLERHWLTAGRRRESRAALIFEESPHRPGAANTFLFTQTPLTSKMLSAVRHFASRLGFTHLHYFARSDSKLPGAVATDYRQHLLMKRLK